MFPGDRVQAVSLRSTAGDKPLFPPGTIPSGLLPAQRTRAVLIRNLCVPLRSGYLCAHLRPSGFFLPEKIRHRTTFNLAAQFEMREP
jgi:hypothetical protein